MACCTNSVSIFTPRSLIRSLTVMLPLLLRHREFLQPLINVHLGVDILNAVILKLLPVSRVMLRKIPGTHPITLRWLTGHGKQLDQPLAFLVFLLLVFNTMPTSFRAIGRVSDAAITIVQIQLSGERNSPGFRYCPGRCLCRCTEKQTRSKEALWAISRTLPDWKSSNSSFGSGSPDARSAHLSRQNHPLHRSPRQPAGSQSLDLWHNGTGRIFRYPPRCRSQYRSAFLSNISPLFDVKSRRTPWHPPARLLICVSLSEGNPAVPHRHRRPEHPHRPARQNQTLLMPCRTDGHHP